MPKREFARSPDVQAKLAEHAIITLAGPIAGQRGAPEENHPAMDRDEWRQEVLFVLHSAFDGDRLSTIYKEWNARAIALVHNRWQAVEAVARELQSKRCLSLVQVDEFIGGAFWTASRSPDSAILPNTEAF